MPVGMTWNDTVAFISDKSKIEELNATLDKAISK